MNCKGCPAGNDLQADGGIIEPMAGRLFNTDGEVDAMFIGDAPNFTEKETFGDTKILTDLIVAEGIGAYLTDLYKCKRGSLAELTRLALSSYCSERLLLELTTYRPSLVCPIGTYSSRTLTDDKSPYQLDGKVSVVWRGYQMDVIALPYPYTPYKGGKELWERRWQLIADYLKKDSDG